MPNYCYRYIHHHWRSGLLLLWFICCLTSLRVSRYRHEESVLWFCSPGIDCHCYAYDARKYKQSITWSLGYSHILKIPAKYLFIRLLRGTPHLNSSNMVHWGTWLACTGGVTIVAYIIASAIPIFSSLVSLIGALLGTLMCFQPYGCMWLYDNWTSGKKDKSLKWCLMVAWSIFVIVSGTFMMIAGTYGSVVTIMKSFQSSGGTGAWSCADNSNST